MHPKSLLCGILFIMSLASLAQDSDFFSSDIVEIEFTFPDSNWQDTLTARKVRGDKTPLLTSLLINGVEYQEADVRYKGNSSFHGALKQGWQKFPFRIQASSGSLFAGKYSKLRLANNYRDPSAIRELLAYEIAGTYVPVPDVVPAALTINGEYQGLYTLTEGMGKAMLQDYFCDDSGTLIQCEPDFRASELPGCPKGNYANLEYLGEQAACYERLYEIESQKDARVIMDLTRRLEKDKRLDTVIDVHQALWMHAINNVLVNLDSYLGLFCHNYFVYRDKHGIYHPLIWDLNLAFGGFSSIAQGKSPEPVKLSPIAHDRFNLGKRPLIQKLMENRSNARLYFWMMRTIVTDWISSGRYIEFANDMQDKLRPFVVSEQGGLYSVSDFDQSMSETVKRADHRSIIGIAQLMEPRAEYLLNHVLLNGVAPEVSDYSAVPSDGKLNIAIDSSPDVKHVQINFKPDVCGKPSSKMMQMTGEGQWQVELPLGSIFYCILSSDTGTALYPSHAPSKYLKG